MKGRRWTPRFNVPRQHIKDSTAIADCLRPLANGHARPSRPTACSIAPFTRDIQSAAAPGCIERRSAESHYTATVEYRRKTDPPIVIDLAQDPCLPFQRQSSRVLWIFGPRNLGFLAHRGRHHGRQLDFSRAKHFAAESAGIARQPDLCGFDARPTTTASWLVPEPAGTTSTVVPHVRGSVAAGRAPLRTKCCWRQVRPLPALLQRVWISAAEPSPGESERS